MRTCEHCGKGSIIRGKRKLLRGHYNPVSTARKYPNLQWATVHGKRAMICTSCIRKLVKPARVRKPRATKKAKKS